MFSVVDFRKDLKKCFGTSKVSFWTIVRAGIRIHEKGACFATFLPEVNAVALLHKHNVSLGISYSSGRISFAKN